MSSFKASQWQSDVWLNTTRFTVINCGRRAGKSTLAVYKMLHVATNDSKRIVWYVAPTYKQAKSIMWSMLAEAIPQEAILKKNETELSVVLRNGSEILLKGADNPDSLRGVRIDFCIFDEVAFIDKWDDAWKVIRPTLMDSRASVWFISTPNGFNHFKDLSERTGIDWKYYHFTTYDNPFIPREEIEASKLEMDEDSFAQEIMGEFRRMSGLIYKDFNRDIHMVTTPNLSMNYTFARSLDFGFGHKTALLYFAINSDGTAIYCYDGLYISGSDVFEISEAVKIKDAGRVITLAVADSAQPMNIKELGMLGATFTPVEKGADSVKFGITKVAELLKVRNDTGKPTLMFDKNLTWIADEFERYRWIENKAAGEIKEVPLKRDDDAMDAVRYFAMSYTKQEDDSTVPDDTIYFQKVTMIETTLQIERWYVELAYNNHNSPAYVDLVTDMAALGDGVFTCTFKINDGNICDYVVMESDTYADTAPSKTYQIPRHHY